MLGGDGGFWPTQSSRAGENVVYAGALVMENVLEQIARVDGVRECLLFDASGTLVAHTERAVADDVYASLEALARRAILTRAEESTLEHGAALLVVRSTGRAFFAIAAEPNVDREALRRRINVVAIKVSARLGPPAAETRPAPAGASPVSMTTLRALEAAAVTRVGPIAKLWFKQALEQAGTDEHSLTQDLAEAMVASIAQKMPDGERWTAEARAILATASGSRRPPPLDPPPRVPSNPPPSVPSVSADRREALRGVLLRHVGPIGNTVFARVGGSAPTASARELIAALAQEIPEDRRAAFIADASRVVGDAG